MRDDYRKGLGLGLSGAHRTGKTTMAEQLAEVNGCPLIRSSASVIAKNMGITVRPGMPMEERRPFQEAILLRSLCDYEEGSDGSMFVSDRTPLDLAAYAMIDWHPAHVTPYEEEWLHDYVGRCTKATAAWFFSIGVVQPGIPYKEEANKPPPSIVYQELLNTTIMGLAMDPTLSTGVRIVPRPMLDNFERCGYVAQGYAKNMTRYQDTLEETMTEH